MRSLGWLTGAFAAVVATGGSGVRTTDRDDAGGSTTMRCPTTREAGATGRDATFAGRAGGDVAPDFTAASDRERGGDSVFMTGCGVETGAIAGAAARITGDAVVCS